MATGCVEGSGRGPDRLCGDTQVTRAQPLFWSYRRDKVEICLSQRHSKGLGECTSHPPLAFPASLSGSVWKVRNHFIHLTLSLHIYVQHNPLDNMFLKNWLLADLIKSLSLSSLGEFLTSSVEYCGGQQTMAICFWGACGLRRNITSLKG